MFVQYKRILGVFCDTHYGRSFYQESEGMRSHLGAGYVEDCKSMKALKMDD